MGSTRSNIDQAPADQPDPAQVTLQVALTGSCTGQPAITEIADELYHVFLDQGATAVRDANGNVTEVDCTATLQFSYPAGYSLQAPVVLVQGSAQADSPESAALAVQMSLAGVATTSQNFDSGFDDEFEINVPSSQAGASPCGSTSATVTVHLTSSSAGSGAATYLQVYDLDGSFSWQRCPP